jgi:ATP-dependent DNA helicase RecQ
VVTLPAAGHPLLVGDVADHLASVGRLEHAGLRLTGTPVAPATMGSAEEAAVWRDAIEVGDDCRAVIRGRPVLLVVDASSSLWPLTLAAAALRRAGASAVLPFLLHRRP